jgi:HSP20 family protein
VPEPELLFDDAAAPAQNRATLGQVAVDIHEQDGYYIIKAPIAGVRMSDIDIEVTDNVLIIRGERRQPDEGGDGRYLVQECFWGPFERRVTLPGPIDPRRVKATFNKESILRILVPREREERVKIVRVGEA